MEHANGGSGREASVSQAHESLPSDCFLGWRVIHEGPLY